MPLKNGSGRRTLLATVGAGLATATAMATTLAKSDAADEDSGRGEAEDTETTAAASDPVAGDSDPDTKRDEETTSGDRDADRERNPEKTPGDDISIDFHDCATVTISGGPADAEWVSTGTLYEMPDGRIRSGVIDDPAAFSVTIDANEFYGDSIVGEAIITGVTVSGADGPLASASPPDEWDCADLVGSE